MNFSVCTLWVLYPGSFYNKPVSQGKSNVFPVIFEMKKSFQLLKSY